MLGIPAVVSLLLVSLTFLSWYPINEDQREAQALFFVNQTMPYTVEIYIKVFQITMCIEFLWIIIVRIDGYHLPWGTHDAIRHLHLYSRLLLCHPNLSSSEQHSDSTFEREASKRVESPVELRPTTPSVDPVNFGVHSIHSRLDECRQINREYGDQ